MSGLGRARRALSVTLAQVQGALAGDQALVELLRYGHYMGNNKWEPRYGALVIASKGEPKWIPLGAAAEIEGSIRALSENRVRGEHGRINAAPGTSNLARSCMGSHRKGPSCGAKTIIFSPDGELNFISFATLLTAGDEFLIEKYSIPYVASGRDLLREREASTTELLAVFGNPDFGSQAELIPRQTETTVRLRCARVRWVTLEAST